MASREEARESRGGGKGDQEVVKCSGLEVQGVGCFVRRYLWSVYKEGVQISRG